MRQRDEGMRQSIAENSIVVGQQDSIDSSYDKVDRIEDATAAAE